MFDVLVARVGFDFPTKKMEGKEGKKRREAGARRVWGAVAHPIICKRYLEVAFAKDH